MATANALAGFARAAAATDVWQAGDHPIDVSDPPAEALAEGQARLPQASPSERGGP
jgi:hypothetical protein